jgi:hypothetical protein
MGLYDFNSDFSVKNARSGAAPKQIPYGLPEIPAVRQLSHAEGGRNPLDGSDFLAYPYHLEEFLTPAFRSLDDAMKQYWSGIRVPTKDSYRFMRVKVSGGEKSLLIWNDDLKEGRARMPVAALSRESHAYNPEKFSPPYHSMTARYLSSRGDLAARVYRPVPYLVDYTLTTWTEHKRDAEYILYQILTRFNPLAEFRMFDGKLEGNIQLRFNGSSDASDKEAGYDQYANVRYEIKMTAEAWLPLPEKIVPTVLGRVAIMRERAGEIFLTSKGAAFPGAERWTSPITDEDEALEELEGTNG